MLTCAIAKDKTKEELTLLATIFTQLGDGLATIVATESIGQCNTKKEIVGNLP